MIQKTGTTESGEGLRPSGRTDQQEKKGLTLYFKLRNLLIIRLIIGTTLLVGAALPLEVSKFYSVSKFLLPLITAILLLTILYAGLLNKLKNLVVLAYIQMIGDVAIETAVTLATGGIESPFSVLYLLTIIIASYLISKRGAYIVSIAASVAFGFVILSQYEGWTAWWPLKPSWILLPPPSFALYIIIVNFTGFYMAAFLGNYLTERIRRADSMLQAKDAQYSYLWNLNQRVFNEIPTGLITTTADGTVVSMNPAMERMLNVRMKEHNTFHIRQILPDYLVKSILNAINDNGQEGLHIQYQSDGGSEKKWYDIQVVPLIRTSGDPMRLMIMFNDVTDQKWLEEARWKVERWGAVAEISAGMAHEIRNPLASISGSIEVLREQMQPDTRESKLMDIIIRESERLNNLISDFLDFSRPRPPNFKRTNLISLLDELKVLFTHSADKNFQKVTLHLDVDREEIRAEIDRDQFVQMAWNLIKNAVDAMRDGGDLTITASVIEENEPVQSPKSVLFPEKPYLKIVFRDTGIGMTEDQIERVFNPFTTFKRKGVGIGLAIVYRIVENHGGYIEVESELKKGSAFIIRLPMVQHKLDDKNQKGDEN